MTLNSAEKKSHLSRLVLVRYAHTYHGSDGLSNHLKAINQQLLLRNKMTIYQVHPVAQGHMPAKSTSGASSGLIDVPFSSALPMELIRKWSRAQEIKAKIKIRVESISTHLSQGLGEARSFFLQPHGAAFGRMIPLIAQELAMARELTERLSDELDRICKDNKGRKILFMDHSPFEPHSWMRMNLARSKNMAVAFEYHGAFTRTSRITLSRLNRNARGSAVTLKNHDDALGPDPVRLGNGIDLEFLDRMNTEAGTFRQAHSIPSHSIMLLVPARVTFGKGHHILVAAIDKLVRKKVLVEATVVFAGQADRSYAEQVLDGASATAAQIRYLQVGALDRVALRAAYADADLVVLPSYSEGIPRAILEAQAMGCPVLATDVGGTSEAFIDGETGLLVPSGSSESLAEGIEEILFRHSLPHDVAVKARRFVQAEYSLGAFAAKHEAFYLLAAGVIDLPTYRAIAEDRDASVST